MIGMQSSDKLRVVKGRPPRTIHEGTGGKVRLIKSKPVTKQPRQLQIPAGHNRLIESQGAKTLAQLFPHDIFPIGMTWPDDFDPAPAYIKAFKVHRGERAVLNSINWNSVIELLKIQCTVDEVYAITGSNSPDFERRCPVLFGMTWSEFRGNHQTHGKASLRRKMIEKAMSGEGDTPMLKHLSAHYLGMTAQSESDTVIPPTNITINFADLKKLQKEANA